MPISKTHGFLMILASFLLGWLIANLGVHYEELEMGAIANLFGPPLCGLISLLLFAIIDYFFKRHRLIVVVLFMLLNLCIGVVVRFKTD